MADRNVVGPIEWLTGGGKNRWLRSRWVFIACAAAVMVILTYRLASLPVTDTTPYGIEFELTGTADGALAVLRAYEDANAEPSLLIQARTAIEWDFLLILSYSIGLASLFEWFGRSKPNKADPLLPYAAWGALLAGACDVVENLAMLFMLREYVQEADPSLGLVALIGTLASLTKWTLLSAVVGYAVWEIAKAAGQSNPRVDPNPRPDLQPILPTGGRVAETAPPAAEPAYRETAPSYYKVDVLGAADESPKDEPVTR